MALFMGKKIVRDDSQREIFDTNEGILYLIPMKGDQNVVYCDFAPNYAVVSYQGKYYRIKNPKYPLGF